MHKKNVSDKKNLQLFLALDSTDKIPFIYRRLACPSVRQIIDSEGLFVESGLRENPSAPRSSPGAFAVVP